MRRRRSYSAAHSLTLSTGQMLRRRALGSDSIYRVRGASGPTVEVEVIEAPGMRPGARIELSVAVARALEGLRAISADAGVAARSIARPAA